MGSFSRGKAGLAWRSAFWGGGAERDQKPFGGRLPGSPRPQGEMGGERGWKPHLRKGGAFLSEVRHYAALRARMAQAERLEQFPK